MDPRQAAITTGQAYNIAAQLLTSDAEYRYSDSTPAELTVIAQAVFPEILKAQQEAEAAVSVANQFPGTLQVAAPQPAAEPFPQNVVQFPQQPVTQAAAPAQPAPIPGAVDGDPQTAALWQQFFADPSKFWDNRQNKRNPKAPDWKHKDTGDGLWLVGKKNPSWVPAQLAARGLA